MGGESTVDHHDNVAVAVRFVEEVFHKGRFEVVGELATDDFVAHGPALFETNRESLQSYLQTLRAMHPHPGARHEIKAVAAEGDLVMVWSASSAQIPAHRYFGKELLDVFRRAQETTGVRVLEQVPAMSVCIFRLFEGKIAELWLFSNYPAEPVSRKP